MILMEQFSAIMLEGRLVFGKHPTDEEFALLVSEGYSTIVDLCPSEEVTWQSYDKTKIIYIHHPIPDRTPEVGDLGTFRTQIIMRLVKIIENNQKVYIHCRGGHGRSALVAAIVYGHLSSCSGETALEAVQAAHKERTEMKPKWRKMGAPQTLAQKRFVVKELKNR